MKKHIKNKKIISTTLFISAVAALNFFAFGSNLKGVFFPKESGIFTPKLYSTVWQDSFQEGMMIPASCPSDPHFANQCSMAPLSCTVSMSPSTVYSGETTNFSWQYGDGVKTFESNCAGTSFSGTVPPYEGTFTGVAPKNSNVCHINIFDNDFYDNHGIISYCQVKYNVLSNVSVSRNGTGSGLVEDHYECLRSSYCDTSNPYDDAGYSQKFKDYCSGDPSCNQSQNVISCGGKCSGTVNVSGILLGSFQYILAATPDASSDFVSWTGCDSVSGNLCYLNLATVLKKNHNIVATFNVKVTYTLSVTKAGAGSGNVTSVPAGIACGADCSENYNSGTSVTLTATPDANSTFTSWSGACSGSGACNVTMNAAKSVTATFASMPPTAALNIQNAAGASIDSTSVGTDVYLNVSGSIAANGIYWVRFCSNDNPASATCGGSWTQGVSWTTSSADASWDATAHKKTWSFGNAGNKGVYVQIKDGVDTWSAEVRDTINVILPNYALTVTKAGAGSGNVTSVPAGIACGADCNESYNSGTAVTLTAIAAFGSTFTGWSGSGCSGTGTCVVTMDAAKSVTATFNTVTCADGCWICDRPCGGGIQLCVKNDCSIYSQSCNTDACPSSADSNWREVAP